MQQMLKYIDAIVEIDAGISYRGITGWAYGKYLRF